MYLDLKRVSNNVAVFKLVPNQHSGLKDQLHVLCVEKEVRLTATKECCGISLFLNFC